MRFTWLTTKPLAAGSVAASTVTSWFWAVTWTRPVSTSRTGWFAPWCPNRRRRVSAPAARPTIWWPRQIPSSGRPSAMIARARATGPASRAGSPGPGREHDARDVGREDVARRGRVGQHADADAAPPQAVHDVRLEAEVDDGDERRVRLRPGIADLERGRRRDRLHEVLVLPAGHAPGPTDRLGLVHLAGRRDQAPQAAVRPQVAGKGPGVDAGDGRDPLVAQERRELAGLLDDGRGRVRDDERPEPRVLGLVVGVDPPVVADERVGHDDDLAGVRGVGADLLVAGLARVHDEVAARRDVRTEGDPAEDRPVLERQEGRPAVADAGVDDEAGIRGGRQLVVTTAPTASRRPGHENATGRVGSVGADEHAHAVPPFRPHGTGTPASRDRPQRTAEG